MKFRQMIYIFAAVMVFALLLAACGSGEGNSVMDATDIPEETATPGPTPTATAIPVSLVVCMGEAPNTLNPYGAPNSAAQEILQALYDGPIDQLGFQYQPVLVESLPSFEDQTVQIKPITVETGNTIVDNQGNLVNLDYGMTIRPAGCYSEECAQSFDGELLEMDQMVVQFSMRQGVTWADGTPLTAADSVYAFNLNGVEDTPASKFKVNRTAAYEAVDETTVRWTGLPGFIDPDYQDNFWTPAPQHLWGSLDAASLFSAGLSAELAVGYGPFNLSEVGADSFTLTRNPAYFRAAEGLPRVDNLVFRVVGQDPQTNLDMLATGECDVLDPSAVAGVGVAEVLSLTAEGQVFASWSDDNGWTLLNFGVSPQSYDDGYNFWAGDRPNFFGDARTRQAVALCIDRQAILDEITLGVAPVMDTYLPADHPLVNPDLPLYRQDTETALALLDEAGWKLNDEGLLQASGIEGVRDTERFEIEILYAEHPQNARVVEMISDQLAACGITAQPVGMTVEELFATGETAPVFGRNFDLAYFAWQSSANPPCNLFLSEAIPGEDEEKFPYKWGGWNATGWSNEAYDAACIAARGSAPGMQRYSENQALAQQILAEEVPVIPFFTYQHAALARTDICGLQMDATGGMLWNVENIAYGASCP